MKQCVVMIICAAAVFLVYGCSTQYLLQDDKGNVLGSPEQKYKALSLIFDGVPKPGEEDPSKKLKIRDRRQPTGTAGFYGEHGPFAAKLCDACHEAGSNELVMPVEELCLNCHVLNLKKKKIHGPVASGGCRVCHNPHGSQYKYFLMDESVKFCFYCHKKEDVLKREVHKQTTEQCTTCHSAHSADNEFLLK